MPEKFLGENSESHQGEAREYRDLLEANFEEHEKWQKNLKEVISAMKRKKDALEEVVTAMHRNRNGSQASSAIRLLVMVLGGGMQGAYGAGQMCALQEMGYSTKNLNEKDAFLGISAGAATCAFGLAGKAQALLGTSYFYTVCCSKEFINFWRLHKVMNVEAVVKALRNEPSRLDTDAVMHNPIQFYVQAYNEIRKQAELINAKAPGVDMVEAIHASMAIPIYNKAVTLGHTQWSDGAFDDPLPITRAIAVLKPTHVLVLPNIAFNMVPQGEPSETARLGLNIIPNVGTLGFIRKVLNHRQILRKSLNKIEHSHSVKIGVAWPEDTGLSVTGRDRAVIKSSIKASAHQMFKLFGEPERELKLYEEEYAVRSV